MALEDRIKKLEDDFDITEKDKIPPLEYTWEEQELAHLSWIIREVDLTKEESDMLRSVSDRCDEVMSMPFRHMDKYAPANWRHMDKKDLPPGMDFDTLLLGIIGKLKEENVEYKNNLLNSDSSIELWEKYVPDTLKPLLRDRTEIINRLLAKEND